MCASFSPTIGLRKGFVNSEKESTDFSLALHGKFSGVWNHKRMFIGIVGKMDASIITDHKSNFLGGNWSISTAVGYRFNLW